MTSDVINMANEQRQFSVVFKTSRKTEGRNIIHAVIILKNALENFQVFQKNCQ